MVTAILSLGKLQFETCSQRCDRGNALVGGAGSDRRATNVQLRLLSLGQTVSTVSMILTG